MKKTLIISTMALGCLALAMGLVLAPKAQAAKPVSATLTGQSIMVNLDAAGTFTIHENQTYKYDEDAATLLFSNTQVGDPAVSCNIQTSGPTTTFETTDPGATPPCDPLVTAPSVPIPDASEVNANGENDVVGDNKCAFLDGTALTGSTYTQSDSNSAQCIYVESSVLQTTGNPANIGKYKVVRKTVTKTCTYTWTYVIAPLQPSYDPFTAWPLYSTNGGGNADVSIGATIAGESVSSTKQWARKYSFSIGGDVDPRVSRVVDLVLTVDGVPYPVGSTVVKNVAGSTPNPTVATLAPYQTIFGDDGALDFWYVENAGHNGHTELLKQPDDARTILNNDDFVGNNDGGADGSALALAVMDSVNVSLPSGDHSVTLTGRVKDNTASLSDITFSVTQIIHIITPGCGGPPSP
jgi:hypothetical protein